MPRKLSLILEDEFIEVDEIFEGGTLHGVDEKVGSDVGKNNERHSPDSYIERLNFRCPGEDDDDGDDESDGRS